MHAATIHTAISLKGIFTKLAIAGAFAGAFLMAVPQTAQAQQFEGRFGFGHPAYGRAWAPAYGPGFYAERREAFARHEAFERHEAFARREAFDHWRWEHSSPVRGRAYGFDR